MRQRRSAWGWEISRLLVIGFVLSTARLAVAQGDEGFLRGMGHLDIALSYGLDTYDEFWIGDDKIDDAPFGRVTRQYVSLYAAYGLTDEIDLGLNGSYVYVDTDHVFDDEDALQDLTTFARVRLGSHRLGSATLNVLAAPGIKVPMTHYEDNSVTAVGDGQVDLHLRGIVQLVFDGGAYVAIETGYDFRFDSPPDEVPINFTGGFTFDRITISGFASRIESLGGYDIGEGPFPGVQEEYWRLGGGVYWRLTESLGLTARGWTTLDGKNTGDVNGFSVGMVFRW